MINVNEIGKVELTNNAFNDIANIAICKMKNIFPVKKGASFANTTIKNNEVEITMSLKVQIGIDVIKTSEKIQTKVHEIVYEMTGVDCKNIIIDIKGFVSK